MATSLAPASVLPSGPHEFHRPHAVALAHRGRQVVDVNLPTPPMGAPAWLLSEKGIFVLHRGPGTLRTIACTHAGSGNLEAIDGIPDDDGFFPAERERMEQPVRAEGEDDATFMARLKAFHTRNGRPFYRANPVVMGSWMLDAGFNHGLTIRAAGGHDSTSAIATVVWMPFRQRGA